MCFATGQTPMLSPLVPSTTDESRRVGEEEPSASSCTRPRDHGERDLCSHGTTMKVEHESGTDWLVKSDPSSPQISDIGYVGSKSTADVGGPTTYLLAVYYLVACT